MTARSTLLLAASATLPLFAQTRAGEVAQTSKPSAAAVSRLDSVLTQMDAGSKRFRSMQASVTYDQYSRVARSHSLSSGSMYVERSGRTNSMGAVVKDENATTPQIVNYSDGVLQQYTPETKQDQIFKAGANQSRYESFLTLGFGGSGHDLQQGWNILDKGTVPIDGISTEQLELTPKDPSVANQFKMVTLWVDPARAISLKQEFVLPDGDSRTALYTHVQLNPAKINKKPYEIPKDAVKFMH